MKLVYNGTNKAIDSATLTVSSSLLKVIDCNAKGWTVYPLYNGKMMISSNIVAGSTYYAKFTTRIKENVQPYNSLILDIKALFLQNNYTQETHFYKSTPTVRAAVPLIKFGELIGNSKYMCNAHFNHSIHVCY